MLHLLMDNKTMAYMESQINPHMDEHASDRWNADGSHARQAGDYYGIQSNESDEEVKILDNQKDTESQFASNSYPSYKKSGGYNGYSKHSQQPQKVYQDELKDRTIPPVKALKDLTRETWIKIPVQQTLKEDSFLYSSQNESLPPRIMWFNLEWSLAEVHRQIVSKYLYMMREYNTGSPTYEEVFGLPLDDPSAELRQEHLDVEQTSLPFMVNIVNPFKDHYNYEFDCRICQKKAKFCKNCPLPPRHDARLIDLLQATVHKVKFGLNDYLFDHNQPQASIGQYDIDSDSEQNQPKSSWYDDESNEKKFIEQPQQNSESSGRHKVFQFEIVFIKKNFQLYHQKEQPEKQKKMQDHPRMKAKIENQTIQNSETLENCLQQFKKCEELGENDTWYCSKCKDHVRAIKQFEIYKAGPVLILSFNRFKQNNVMYQEKVADPVTFPIYGLDLGSHLLSKSKVQAQPANQNHVYDLFGVINHYGSLNFGHYTAYAKNSDTGQWHLYNDETVTSCEPHDVVTEAAYVLFYQLRSVAPENTAQLEQVYQKYLQKPQLTNFQEISKSKQGHKLISLALGKQQTSLSNQEGSPLDKKSSQGNEKVIEETKEEELKEPEKQVKQEPTGDTMNDEELARILQQQFQNEAYQDWNPQNFGEQNQDGTAAPSGGLNQDIPSYDGGFNQNFHPPQGQSGDVQMRSHESEEELADYAGKYNPYEGGPTDGGFLNLISDSDAED